MKLRSHRLALAVSVIVLAATAACSQAGNTSVEGGEGVPAGSAKTDYKKAFANVDPITIRVQTGYPAGSENPFKYYLQDVEEWSDGKIKFEIYDATAVAEFIDADDAVADGRLDMAQYAPIYEPSEYPATAALANVSTLTTNSIQFGPLQLMGWLNEFALSTPQISTEFDERGLKLLLPAFQASPSGQLVCKEPVNDLKELKGVLTRAGNEAASAGVSALGASPVSLPGTEQFEALQRGVIDCSVMDLPTIKTYGIAEVASHVVYDSAVGFGGATSAVVFSKDRWESLPLVAQQLLWDRLPFFATSLFEHRTWPDFEISAHSITDAGGSIGPFAPDAREALIASNDKVVEKIADNDAIDDGDKYVTSARNISSQWKSKLEDLGFTAEPDLETWLTTYSGRSGTVDLDKYDTTLRDSLSRFRPGSA